MPLLTGEQVAYCNSVDLMELARLKGYTPRKVGTDSYKIDGFGGLYINPSANQWNCFAEGKGGGPIQFLMFVEQTSWRRAAEELLQGKYEPEPIKIWRRPIQDESKKAFILPEKNKTYDHMIAYLIKTRKIEKEIVYHFIQNKQLYENEKKACVFVAYDENKTPRFASWRSTGTDYTSRGNVAGGDKNYVFAKEGTAECDRLFVFESPTDLMSYLTLLHQADPRNRLGNLPQHFISLEGLAQIGLDHYLQMHPQIRQITLCLDNDEWGNKASERFAVHYKNEGYKVMRHLPDSPAKDFNEMLVNQELAKERQPIEEAASEMS